MVDTYRTDPPANRVGHGSTQETPDVIERIRSELLGGSAAGRVTKMTSLLRAFRPDDKVTVSQRQVEDQLARARVHIKRTASGADADPAIQRSSLVTLSVDDAEGRGTNGAVRTEMWSVTDGAFVRSPAAAGEAGEGRAAEGQRAGIAWIDVSFAPGPEGSVDSMVDQLREALHEVRPKADVTPEMLKNVLCRDDRPAVTTFGDESSEIRGWSVLAVVSQESPAADGAVPPFDLIVQPVELLVGSDWLVTCWQAPYLRTTVTRHGNRQSGGPEPQELLHEPFLARVQQQFQDRWASTHITASDLALDFVRGVVDTYEGSVRAMSTWTSHWRRANATSPKRLSAHPIAQMAAMVSELSSDASDLLHARHDTRDRTWLSGLSGLKPQTEGRPTNAQVEGLDRHLGDILRQVKELEGRVASDVQSAALRSSEQLQTSLAIVTGVFLIPTLVVGFFGANTALPGQGSWGGFIAMVLLIVCSISVALAVYWRVRRGNA